MWQNAALLMLFFVVLSSASKLEHFKGNFVEGMSRFSFHGVKAAPYLFTGNLHQAADDCSEVCYGNKYFCELFILVEIPDGRHECLLCNGRTSSFRRSLLPTGFVTRAIYGRYARNDIEPLEKRFSSDNGVENLETGYFPRSQSISMDIIAASIKAMNSKPAVAIDFDKWVSSKDISQSRRMPFELYDFTGWKIMEAVKSWEKSLNLNNQEPTGYFDTLLLTFLDIFCPLLQKGISTIYDPVKKVIFIAKKDLSILVISYGPGDLAVVYSIDNVQWPEGNCMVYLSNSLRREGDSSGNPVQLFEQATGKRISEAFYEDIPDDPENETGEKKFLLFVLEMVLVSLTVDHRPPNFVNRIYSNSLRGPLFIFYHDMITAVLSSVYKNHERHPIFSNLKTMQTRNFFSDVDFYPPQQ